MLTLRESMPPATETLELKQASFAVTLVDGIPNLIGIPSRESLRHDPNHVGAELASCINEAKRERMVPWCSMTTEVAVAAELYRVLRERLTSDTSEVLNSLPVRLGIRVPFHLRSLFSLVRNGQLFSLGPRVRGFNPFVRRSGHPGSSNLGS